MQTRRTQSQKWCQILVRRKLFYIFFFTKDNFNVAKVEYFFWQIKRLRQKQIRLNLICFWFEVMKSFLFCNITKLYTFIGICYPWFQTLFAKWTSDEKKTSVKAVQSVLFFLLLRFSSYFCNSWQEKPDCLSKDYMYME